MIMAALNPLFKLVAVWLCVVSMGIYSVGQEPVLLSSYSHPETWLRPFDWTYLRVELPPFFSSIAIKFTSDAKIDMDSMNHLPRSRLPVICINDGSPPLPDISPTYQMNLLNWSFETVQNLSGLELCIPFRESLALTLTNEQISPGIWYMGFFNGLGPARTQSKMISRGRAYMFSTRIDVEGCSTSTMWGPYCNLTIGTLSCSGSAIYKQSRNLLGINSYNGMTSSSNLMRSKRHKYLQSTRNALEGKQEAANSSMFWPDETLITCSSLTESSCLGYGELKYYSLDIVGLTSQFTIAATDFRYNKTFSVNNVSGLHLMCYARYNALPLDNVYDFSAEISQVSLTVKSPKIGRWYVAIKAVNVASSEPNSSLCFLFAWQLQECIDGKAGVNCTSESLKLQRAPRRGSSIPFESYYQPIDENQPIKSSFFALEQFLSNSSVDNVSWTYFSVDVPPGAAGVNMRVQLTSDTQVNYELFSRFGGIPYVDNWDYYANSTGSSNGSKIFALDFSNEGQIEFYILYAREGTWSFGLKHTPDSREKYNTMMSISLVGCPRHCSSNGQCHYSVEENEFTFYSYCGCDRDHGGFDCGDELVTRQGHIWQSICLIASNAAAIMPAFCALRQKAFAEWVLFTASGISSGLYHACDVGTWCALSFRVLQFMDFWLSFMAVASTFVYMATIDDASKRAIHTSISILTALLAVSGATRSSNIALVVAIGTIGLLVGWFLEFSTMSRSRYCPTGLHFNMPERWQTMKRWSYNLIRTLQKRFRWPFMLLGFAALAAAAISWKLETNNTYWIWHSLWHITIYTSSFFFLCSTVTKSDAGEQEPEYELARQNSLPRTG